MFRMLGKSFNKTIVECKGVMEIWCELFKGGFNKTIVECKDT